MEDYGDYLEGGGVFQFGGQEQYYKYCEEGDKVIVLVVGWQGQEQQCVEDSYYYKVDQCYVGFIEVVGDCFVY